MPQTSTNIARMAYVFVLVSLPELQCIHVCAYFPQLPGEMYHFRAEDGGDVAQLKRTSSGILAMETLCLKRGCPVMLVVNLCSNLVNGSMGLVLDICDEGPVVNFVDAGVTLKVKRYSFTGRQYPAEW